MVFIHVVLPRYMFNYGSQTMVVLSKNLFGTENEI